jgi:rubredoxin
MSIDMEHFGSTAQRTETRPQSDATSLAFPYRLQCRACGFEPEDAITPPHRCPKCAGSAWERFALPRSLLTGADQRAGDRAERALSAQRMPELAASTHGRNFKPFLDRSSS